MKVALVICTYMRPQALLNLLQSVQSQTRYPNAIYIIDGSSDTATAEMLNTLHFPKLTYYQVTPAERGLTKQRNIGVALAKESSDVISFLDDDTILDTHYFEEIMQTFSSGANILGVGGYITNEVKWLVHPPNEPKQINYFYYEGWKRREGSRFILRKRLGLDSNLPPGYMPEFGHGRSIGFLPPSGKKYPVEQLMGGVASYRTAVFDSFQFASFFEGYGLYEDADFSLRVSKTGQLAINTRATLEHHHEPSGRPNSYKYGKMVVRNGWYVWRVKNSHPTFNAQMKWHVITLLLIFIRVSNIFTTSSRKSAFLESTGRMVGWLSLWVQRPK
jgi:GT2 family glycosyltransferase